MEAYAGTSEMRFQFHRNEAPNGRGIEDDKILYTPSGISFECAVATEDINDAN
jgi:hypothetical protein